MMAGVEVDIPGDAPVTSAVWFDGMWKKAALTLFLFASLVVALFVVWLGVRAIMSPIPF